MHLPFWLDPLATDPLFLAFWCVVAFAFAVIGAEWTADSLCTFAIAAKLDPLLTGIFIVNIVGALPFLVLIGMLGHAGNSSAAMGVAFGGGWLMLLLPLCLAGMRIPITARPSWISCDLPFLISSLVVFVFFCSDKGISRAHALIFLAIVAWFLVLKYIQTQEGRYSVGSFGKNFVFGVSIITTLSRLGLGLVLQALSCLYLSLAIVSVGSRWGVPLLPLGFLMAVPLCFGEINFALSAVARGQGELVPLRGVWMGLLVILLGGATLGFLRLNVNPNDLCLVPPALIALLVALWAYLRANRGVLRGALGLILVATAVIVWLAWAQGLGCLLNFALPKSFELAN